MSTWKKVMICALCLLSAAALVFTGLVCHVYYEKKHPYYQYVPSPMRLSDHIVMEYVKGYDAYRVRLKDMRTGKYTTPQLQHVFLTQYNDHDSLAVYRSLDYERGYVNIYTGKIVIPAKYNRAWNFSEGIAGVYKDGLVSFINSSGEPAFEKTFPIRYYDDYSEIAFIFHNGLCVMRTMDNKWGLINTQGEWAVEPVYNTIDAPYFGYRRVFNGNKYGLLDAYGKMALPVEYDDIRRASDGNGWVLVKDGLAKEVDFQLRVTIPFVYDELHILSSIDDYREEGYYEPDDYRQAHPEDPQFYRFDIGMNSGVIDAQGHVIIPAIFYNVRIVNDEFFEVEATSGGERFLYNTKGQYVGKSGI